MNETPTFQNDLELAKNLNFHSHILPGHDKVVVIHSELRAFFEAMDWDRTNTNNATPFKSITNHAPSFDDLASNSVSLSPVISSASERNC